jgi:hypothetical protein
MNGTMKNQVFQPIGSVLNRSVLWLKVVPLLLLLSSSFLQVQAQCTLVCNSPNPASALDIGVDQNCEVLLNSDMVLEDPGSCPPLGNKILEVRTLAGNLVVSQVEPVLITSNYLGQTLSVTVIDPGSGNSCTGYIMLNDNLAPVLTNCDDFEVSCIEGFDPANIGGATVTDNCDVNPMLTFSNQVTGPDCVTGSPYIYVVTRTWTATDDNNNQSQCTQVISVLRESVEDVIPPADAYLDCDNPDADPSITGYPTLNGFDIDGTNLCQITADFSDDTIYTCLPALHSYFINRTWLVLDNCPPTGVEEFMQKIFVEDNDAPTITCPSTLTFGTDGGDICTASFFMPYPTASDNCSDASGISFTISSPFPNSDLDFPFTGVPVGTYTFTYQGTDDCGNVGTCETQVTVVDDDVPTAICDEFTVVTIPTNGIAVVPAFNLDDGSYDNCSLIDFIGSRDNGVTFSPFLTFDCSDVGMSIDVILRVFEVGNPSSFNDCEVVVNVQDLLPPVIDCPDNLTVDCQDFSNDLSVYGFPFVFDNCEYTLTSDSTITLDNCGEGTVVRTFTAEDPSGNSISCTQTINVEILTPYDGTTIDWPDDLTVENGCAPVEDFDPEDLSYPYDEPVIPNEACALAAVNYSDQVFFTSYPACYKIIRTWTVIDWCTYDPSDPGAGSIWTEVQTIKFIDTEDPVITFTPDDVTVAVGPNCQTGTVTLDPVTATDCSPDIEITNLSPYSDNNGADASGEYPVGEHEVVFEVEDGCGNLVRDTVIVTVEDQTPPSPTCLVGLSAELGEMGNVVMTNVPATFLLVEANDNCTDPADIQVFIDIDDPSTTNIPTTTSLDFFCDDVGFVDVEIWVVDEEGNGDFCTTTIEIEDNFNLCPPNFSTATVAGLLEDEAGNEIDQVSVMLSGQQNMEDEGSPFEFADLETGYDYTVTPELNLDPGNGVTTWDLVLISRHILGVELLDSPYKIIAADANRSGSVSTLDLVDIQKIILNMEEEFPNNTSWRFVDASFQFTDPADPFVDPFPEVINFNNLSGDELEADFIGVKVGDVNTSAAPNADAFPAGQRGFVDVLFLETQNQMLEAGKIYDVAISAANFNDIIGFQMTLDFDPLLMRPVGVEACDLPYLDENNFGFNYAEEGMLSCSWNQWSGLTLPDGTCLFVLQMEAVGTDYIGNSLQVSSSLTPAEAYWPDGSLLDIQMNMAPLSQVGVGPLDFELYQNRPNPFTGNTVIGFRLNEGGAVNLKVFDLSGRMVYAMQQDLPQGYHEWTINRDQLSESSMYYYQLETKAGTQTRKMILLD